MSKITLLAAFGAGYVLGARAGRDRYDQIRAGAQKVAENPRVQSATETAREKAGEVAATVAESAKEKADDAVHAVKDKVQRDDSTSTTSTTSTTGTTTTGTATGTGGSGTTGSTGSI